VVKLYSGGTPAARYHRGFGGQLAIA
jgi:hypothetical protein